MTEPPKSGNIKEVFAQMPRSEDSQKDFEYPKNFENSVSQKKRITKGGNSGKTHKKKKTITWEKENRSEVYEKEEFNMLNPIKKVKSIFLTPHHRKTNFNLGKLEENRKVKIELVSTSVFLGYNQIRSLNGIDKVLDQVKFTI